MNAVDALEKHFANLKKSHADHKKAARTFLKSLTAEETAVLSLYQGDGYVLINQILFEKWALNTVPFMLAVGFTSKPESWGDSKFVAHDEYIRRTACELPGKLLAAVKHIDGLLERAPKAKERMTVFRGVQGAFAATLSSLPVGGRIVVDTYLSTSYDPTVAYHFASRKSPHVLLVIDVPKGTPYVYMDAKAGSVWESELLMPRGCSLRVVQRQPQRIDPTQPLDAKPLRKTTVIHATLGIDPSDAAAVPASPDTTKMMLTISPMCGDNKDHGR